jgi:hypothetical protein
MRPFALAALLVLAVSALDASVQAQEPGARRLQPPPDHWMTIDSLAQALGLTADQRAKVTPPYTALNGVLRDAAARRQAMRQRMQGGFRPGQAPTPEMRARMDSARVEFEGFQAEADEWLAAIRNLLTAAQQAKFDALPKPVVAMRMRRLAPGQ